MRQPATASMADAAARRSVCSSCLIHDQHAFHTCTSLAYSSYPFCSDMSILKIAAVVESGGIEPVEWDKRRPTPTR